MHAKKILGIGLLVVVGMMYCSTALGATVVQWFPSQGTVSDYVISWTMCYANKTRGADNQFNVYNASPNIYLVPIWLETNTNFHDLYPSWVLLESNTNAKFHHAYAESTSTTWNRSLQVITTNNTFTNQIVNIITWATSGPNSGLYRMNTTTDSVQKNGFFTTGSTFLDYFDQLLSPPEDFITPHRTSGGMFYFPTRIVGKTESSIIAIWVLDAGGEVKNGTYIADTSGRVISYSYSLTGGSVPTDILGYSLSFTLIGGIPDFVLDIIFIAIGIAGGIALGALIWKRKSSEKRSK